MKKAEAEGGCGVIGIACQKKIAGKHLLTALQQMKNRGNGKGGGIAAVGLDPTFFNVEKDVLQSTTLLAIGYLDITKREEVEKECIAPHFEVLHRHTLKHLEDYRQLDLEVKPPDVILYFVRVKEKSLSLEEQQDLIYQNSYQLNCKFYSAIGQKVAFVLSHAKNLLVLKMVGYGDDVIKYYLLENLKAHVWIGHHRYPTKGKVWHPGGAHPFVGLNEALVHNGDFSNYYSLVEYLSQQNIHPHFLTDTEVAALLFDFYVRKLKYPLEHVIEAFAPTTERDFSLLPPEKLHPYHLLQKTHIHSSPDGPWFFLIAESMPENGYRLTGITDTSMLRPQVFALQKGPSPIGFAASEKQAIDAALKSLHDDDDQFWECADLYWNARGGSHQDGGAFTFTVYEDAPTLEVKNKFSSPIHIHDPHPPYIKKFIKPTYEKYDFNDVAKYDYSSLMGYLNLLQKKAAVDVLPILTKLCDYPIVLEKMRQSSFKALINQALVTLFKSNPNIGDAYVLNGEKFPIDGENSLAREIVSKYNDGHKKFILYNCKGHRFIGCGLGSQSFGVEIDVYGSPGDYLASGIDGANIKVHGSAQDQLAQIMLNGNLTIYGDVGQTFMYGAKGGTAFILGNTAGRPLINAVGNPRVVINGTSLDYLGESFMAGDPLHRGGFAIVNGIKIECGGIVDLDTPYPGSNLFSQASGGAIYIRDPRGLLKENQLNGGKFVDLTVDDWHLLSPYLDENQELFNIPVSRLLQHDDKTLPYHKIYRKIIPIHTHSQQVEEAWVKGRDV